MNETPLSTSDQTAPTHMARSWVLGFWLAALLTCILDLWSKYAVFAHVFTDPETLRCFWTASKPDYPSWFNPAWNTGVAWSFMSSMPVVVAVMTMLLIPLIAWVYFRWYRLLGLSENIAFGLVLGGAVANAWDRLGAHMSDTLYGVRDFIHVDFGFPPFDPWPTFNIADAGISVGFMILLATSFFNKNVEDSTSNQPK